MDLTIFARPFSQYTTLYDRARYYNPRSGRFLSEDPIGFAGGDYNFYRYVGNNPVKLYDPFGLKIPSAGQEMITDAWADLGDALFGYKFKDDWAKQMEYQRKVERDRYQKYLEEEQRLEKEKRDPLKRKQSCSL